MIRHKSQSSRRHKVPGKGSGFWAFLWSGPSLWGQHPPSRTTHRLQCHLVMRGTRFSQNDNNTKKEQQNKTDLKVGKAEVYILLQLYNKLYFYNKSQSNS